MRVTMLDTETGRLAKDEPVMHFRAGQSYDVPDDVGRAWIGHSPPIATEVNAETARESEALPDGYSATKAGGGYYTLKGPDGVVIKGPSNKKWQGADGAALAAWDHHRAMSHFKGNE